MDLRSKIKRRVQESMYSHFKQLGFGIPNYEKVLGKKWKVVIDRLEEGLPTKELNELWHLDHKIPKAAVVITSVSIFKVWNLKNLRFMFGVDNQKKNRYIRREDLNEVTFLANTLFRKVEFTMKEYKNLRRFYENS